MSLSILKPRHTETSLGVTQSVHEIIKEARLRTEVSSKIAPP